MKRKYNKPSLTIHGNLEQITKAIGTAPIADTIIINGQPLSIPTDGESVDLVINI